MIAAGAKIVVRYGDRGVLAGYTYDLAPRRPRFHDFATLYASWDATPAPHSELKAVSVVRECAGDARYRERNGLPDGPAPTGRRICRASR
jgi:hypothetical protein